MKFKSGRTLWNRHLQGPSVGAADRQDAVPVHQPVATVKSGSQGTWRQLNEPKVRCLDRKSKLDTFRTPSSAELVAACRYLPDKGGDG